jgi:carotenoid 1,2-hydratase
MLAIGAAEQALTQGALDAPGGFLWWYLDLVSPSGDGLVLIWSFGLPFLPGRESASRRGQGVAGREQPSIAISIYRAGRPQFYLLHQVEAGDASVDLATGDVRLGDSAFRSFVDARGDRHVEIALNVPVPGAGRLVGTASARGRALRVPGAAAADHVWSPLTVTADASAKLSLDGAPFVDLRGRGYHDCNGSTLPLSSLGIHEWGWGREAQGDVDEVHYVLWPEGGGAPTAHLLRLHLSGEVEVEEAELIEADRRVGWFGLPWRGRLLLRGRSGRERAVQAGPVVDDGPFYLRSLLGQGMAEWVRPSRVDAWWSRPFVRMCVQRRERNSVLLPFFTGDRATRWRRLVGLGSPALQGSGA